MYRIKNLSDNTLKIMGKIIFPGEEFSTYNIQPYQNSIHKGTLQIIANANNNSTKIIPNKREINKNINNYINQFIINNEKKNIQQNNEKHTMQPPKKINEKSMPIINLFDNSQFYENIFTKKNIQQTVAAKEEKKETIVDQFISKLNQNNNDSNDNLINSNSGKTSEIINQNELKDVKNQLLEINNNLNIQENNIKEQNNIINNLQDNIINNIQTIIKDNITSILETQQNDSQIIEANEVETKSQLDKEKVIQSLFHFYLDRNISSTDLDNIKQFYNYIGITKNIPLNIQNNIEKSSSYEEFITILLNNVYPILL